MGSITRFTRLVPIVLLALGVTVPALAASIFDFHYGTMNKGHGATGTIPTWTLLWHFADEPLDHTHDEFVRKIFGPAFPNVSDFIWTVSGHRLRFTNGAVMGPLSPPDDPDTVLHEDLRWDSENLTNPRILYFGMRNRSGYLLEAVGAGGGAARVSYPDSDPVNHTLISWKTFALVAVSLRDGELYSGDMVALKTAHGYFLRNVSGTLLADGAGYNATDQRFFIKKDGPTLGGQIYNGDGFTLQSVSTGKYLRATSGNAVRSWRTSRRRR